MVQEVEKYQRAVKKIFSSEDGKVVLEVLKRTYLNVLCLSETSEITHYRLGQKELVQQLLADIEVDVVEDNVTLQEILDEQ